MLYLSFLLLSLLAGFEVCSANKAWFFRKSTVGGVFEDGKTIVLEEVPEPPAPGPGELTVDIIATSVIPSYRGRMEPETWPVNQADYMPFPLNEILVVESILVVTASTVDTYKVGDIITGFYKLQISQNVKADGSDTLFRLPPTVLPSGVPIEKFLSISSFAGGLTAFYVTEYTDIGQVEPGQTVLVTAASSTVGQIVGQLYKLKGCTVIGSTSTSEKAAKTIALGGYDHMIAYKEEDFDTRLNELAPDGIDLVFENVGGTQLDTALKYMKPFGKAVLCGLISDYNKKESDRHGIKRAMDIVIKRLRVEGILVMDLLPNAMEAIPKMAGMVMAGELRSEETVIEGFEKWGSAIDMMLASASFGRLVVKVPQVVQHDEL